MAKVAPAGPVTKTFAFRTSNILLFSIIRTRTRFLSPAQHSNSTYSWNVSGHAVRVYWLVIKKILVIGFSNVLDIRLWHRAISMRVAVSPAMAVTKQQLIINC